MRLSGLRFRRRTPLTLDTHVDIPRTYMREARFDAGTDTGLRVDLGKMERGGLDAAFFVIFVEQGPRTPEGYAAAFAAAERKVSAIEDMVRKYPERIRLATSPEDVVENHAAGRLSAMMGIENGFVIGKDLAQARCAVRARRALHRPHAYRPQRHLHQLRCAEGVRRHAGPGERRA